jgi:hypothetical protein
MLPAMHAIVRGSLAVALLAAAGTPEPPEASSPVPGQAPALKVAVRCTKRSLPAGTDCVALPPVREPLSGARQRRLARQQPTAPGLRHSERQQVPRKPDRSPRFTDYQLPVDPVLSVAMLDDAPDSDAGELAVRIDADPNSPISLVELNGQNGPAEVVLVGQLRGVTVITRHRVAAADGEREYLAFYGHLGKPGPRIVNGARLSPLEVVGFVGSGAGTSQAWFSLETRLMRGPLQLPVQHLNELLPLSVATDVRNVLPLLGSSPAPSSSAPTP